jgi:hypothetical protein
MQQDETSENKSTCCQIRNLRTWIDFHYIREILQPAIVINVQRWRKILDETDRKVKTAVTRRLTTEDMDFLQYEI